jgi:hypothetical protein
VIGRALRRRPILCAAAILSVSATAHASTPTLAVGADCSVTVPNGHGPPPANYGNDGLAVGLSPTGRYDALVFYEANHGEISVKFPWVRLVKGQLRISARRLDRPAPPAKARVPSGYGDSGFQASGVVFPTVGCWQVTGFVGDASLTFVIELTGEIPVAHATIVSAVTHRTTATIRWKGDDASERFDVAVRRHGAPWRVVVWRTTGTRYVVQRDKAHRIDVRVRGLDKWLNTGPWSRSVSLPQS